MTRFITCRLHDMPDQSNSRTVTLNVDDIKRFWPVAGPVKGTLIVTGDGDQLFVDAYADDVRAALLDDSLVVRDIEGLLPSLDL